MGLFAPANADAALAVLDMMDFEGIEKVRERVQQNGTLYTQLQQAMEQLPEDQRAALVLREFQQLSYEEIANALQQPEGTIKSRINRAREKVKNFVRQAEQNGCSSVKENEGRQK